MATINEIKDKMVVVNSVGGFANALQQIATMRMMALRDRVVASKRFVDEATMILRELNLYKEIIYQQEMNLLPVNASLGASACVVFHYILPMAQLPDITVSLFILFISIQYLVFPFVPVFIVVIRSSTGTALRKCVSGKFPLHAVAV